MKRSFCARAVRYRSACKVFDLDTLNAMPFYWLNRADGEVRPEWVEFGEALILAERIDSFLSVLGRGGPGAALARDCRENLDLLLVLADWCQDGGQVRAAAESTHLHELACSVYRSLGVLGQKLQGACSLFRSLVLTLPRPKRGA